MHDPELGKSFSFKDFISLIIAFGFLIFAGMTHHKNPRPNLVLSKQDTAINLNNKLLTYFNLGNKRLIADLLWIQTLLESDEEHYGHDNLNSWMYLRFLSIANLDPLFYENYLYGGLYLSIVKDDVLGASEIFEKGLFYYPKDYKLNYYAGFNYYFEQGDIKNGLKKLDQIKNYKEAPVFLSKIVEKLRFETSHNPKTALIFLKNEYITTTDDFLKKKLSVDIYALQAETDLECLNANKENCNLIDAEGIRYQKESGHWKSKRTFAPYRINTPNRK
jgi:hypothetical protein